MLCLKPTLLAASTCLLILTAACRDDQPPPPYPYNLGTADQPLLPTVTPDRHNDILTGRATLVDLASPDQLAAPRGDDAGQPGDAERPPDQADDDRAAIEDLVGQYLAAFEARDFGNIATLHVERQRPVLEATSAPTVELLESVDAFLTALEEADPQAYAQMSLMFASMAKPQINLDQLMIESETEATIPTPQSPTGQIRFEKHGGDWLIVDPGLPDDPGAAIQMLTAMKQAVDRMAAIVGDTSLTAEQRAAQLTTAMMTMAQGGPPSGDDGS